MYSSVSGHVDYLQANMNDAAKNTCVLGFGPVFAFLLGTYML